MEAEALVAVRLCGQGVYYPKGVCYRASFPDQTYRDRL
jgi:hypothetical protein